MAFRLAILAALALAAPAGAHGASSSARLAVRARVVRSVEVQASSAAVAVRTSGEPAWSAPLSGPARVEGVDASPCASDPRYVVVTVLADAAPSARARAAR